MSLPVRRSLLRRLLPPLSICVFVCAAFVANAQDTTTFLPVPKGDAANEYLDVIPENQQPSARYVDETDQDFLNPETPVQARGEDQPRQQFNGPNIGVFGIVLILAVLLFVFLKYGGAGGLFQADPNAEKKPKKRARAWGLTAAEESAGDIIAKIRAMASRRDALILLLRHCLLQAADETDVHFLRADTEREALARLPESWRRFTQLTSLLRQTELVHYGGRDITDADFETAVSNGAQILMEAR